MSNSVGMRQGLRSRRNVLKAVAALGFSASLSDVSAEEAKREYVCSPCGCARDHGGTFIRAIGEARGVRRPGYR